MPLPYLFILCTHIIISCGYSFRNFRAQPKYLGPHRASNFFTALDSDIFMNYLILASSYGHTNLFKNMYGNFTSNDLYETNEETFLLHKLCLTTNNTEVVQNVLETDENFDINSVDDDGLTLLHIAVMNNNKELLKMLFKYSPDIITSQYGTALDLAAAFYYHDLFIMLLDYYCDKNKSNDLTFEDSIGLTLLQRFCVLGKIETIETLLVFELKLKESENKKFLSDDFIGTGLYNRRNGPILSLIEICTFFNAANVMKLLLQFNPDLLSKEHRRSQSSAIHYAVQHEKADMLGLFLSSDINMILLKEKEDEERDFQKITSGVDYTYYEFYGDD